MSATNKRMEPTKEPDRTGFFWTRIPDFTPPAKDGGITACVEQEFVPPRAGDLKTLLNRFLETAISMVHAGAGVIRVTLPDEQTLQIISSIGLSSEQLEAECIVELVCEECGKGAFRRGLCSTNIENCEVRQGGETHRQFKSVISVPLESRNTPDVLLGVFTLFFDTPQSSSGHAADTAVTFADLLGALIEHVRSNRETRRAELLMERQSIANEIHDSLAQTLNYARMNTTLLTDAVRNNDGAIATRYAQDIDEALEISQKAVRALITDFRSEMDPAGLLHALQTLVERFRQQNNIVLDCAIRVADLDLPLEHEIQTYHIVHEALSNVAKHSNASHARLIVDHCAGYYVFTVEDNGTGGDDLTPVEGHYGIIIMRERAQRIGGEIRTESAKGLGTSVQLLFPEPGTNWRIMHDE